MGEYLKVLFVDGQLDESIKIDLQKEFENIDLIHVTDSDTFVEALKNKELSAVITEYQLGWSDAFSIFHKVKQLSPACPVFLLTDNSDVDLAVTALKIGIKDYIVKDEDASEKLKKAIKNFIAQKESPNLIEAIEERYRNLVEHIPIGLYRSTTDGKMMETNQAFIDMLKYPSKTEIEKISTRELYADPSDQITWKKLMTANKKVNGFVCRFRCYDGSLIWGEENAAIVTDKIGNTQYFEGSLMDITARKIAEQALIESEANYREIFNAANDVIIVSDIESGHIIDCNQKMVEMFKFSVADSKKMKVQDLIDDSYATSTLHFHDYILKAIEGVPQMFEWLARDRDQESFWIEVNVKRAYIGGVHRLLLIFRNIDDRKRLQDEQEKMRFQLVQAQKTESVTNLVSGLTHEFNNYLTAVQGYTELALSELDNSSEVSILLMDTLKATFKAASLVRQLLIFSINQSTAIAEINLNQLIQDLMVLIRLTVGEKINIHMQLDPALCMIMSSKINSEQVVMNLISNARDSMPGGGDLFIQTRNLIVRDNAGGNSGQHVSGNYVELLIKDTGIGISTEVLPHIFKPFFTTKDSERGSGLGLSVVDTIVKKSDGWIDVSSEPGIGTEIRIVFPAMEVLPEIVPVRGESFSGNGANLLVIEDDDDLRYFLVKALEKHNYTVLPAYNAQQGREIIKTKGNTLTAIYCDVILPDGNGHELMKSVHLERPDIKIILASGYLDERIQLRDQAALGFKFLSKPFKLLDLLIELKQTGS